MDNLKDLDLVTELDLIMDFDLIVKLQEISIEHLQRVQLANRGRLLLKTTGPVQSRTCIFLYARLQTGRIMVW